MPSLFDEADESDSNSPPFQDIEFQKMLRYSRYGGINDITQEPWLAHRETYQVSLYPNPWDTNHLQIWYLGLVYTGVDILGTFFRR